jgi:hypothetical protein
MVVRLLLLFQQRLHDHVVLQRGDQAWPTAQPPGQ